MYLQAMALLPEDGDTDYGEDHFWANNGFGNCYAFRGGSWDGSSTYGIFALKLIYPNNYASLHIGGRSVFIEI